MSYSQKRILHTLLTIVAALVLLLAVVTALKKRGAEEQEPDASASSPEEGLVAQAAEYGTLLYDNGTATLSFATDEEGRWYWADDPSFPLAQTYVTRIIDTIATLKPQQTITDGDALEDYGLSQPAMTITATSGTVGDDPNSSSGGETRTETASTTLYIGNQVSGGSGSYYLYIDGAPETIYVVTDTLVTQISRGIYDMMELPELEELEESAIRSITVRGPSVPAAEEGGDPTPGLTTALTASAGEDIVTWKAGGEDVSGNERAQKLIALAQTISLEKCVDFKPSEAAAALCGFDNPAATAVVRYQASGQEELQTRTIIVGKSAMDGESRYVRVDDDTTIYAVSAGILTPLLQTAESGLAEN